MLKGNKKTMLPFSNGKVSWQAGEICDSLVSMIALHIAVTVCRMFSASPDLLPRPGRRPSAKNPFLCSDGLVVTCTVLMFFAPLPLNRRNAPKQSLCGYAGMLALLYYPVNTFWPFLAGILTDLELFVKDYKETDWVRKNAGKIAAGRREYKKWIREEKVLAFFKRCSYNECQTKARVFCMNHQSFTTAFSFSFCGRFIGGGYFCWDE